MNLETMLIISAVVAAVGALSAGSLRGTGSQYLITVSGTRAHLILVGGLIWVSAVAVGLLGLGLVSLVAPSVVAVALFFGFEAVALDICAHRVAYQRVDSPRSRHARIPVPHQ